MADNPLNTDETPSVDPRLLAEAKEAVDFLTKTAKVFRTYPRENNISISAIDNLHRSFSAYLEKHESLELFVNQHELLFEGVTVYSETDPRRSFALKLDRDGVRRIMFYKDIQRSEIVGLLDSLTAEVGDESLEDDIVTLLWEKQLAHVKVFVLDDFATGESGFDPGLVGGGDMKGTDEASGSDQISRRRAAAVLEGSGAASSEHTGLPELCVATKEKIHPLTAEQCVTLEDLTKKEEAHDVSDDLEDILFDILKMETDTEVYTNAVKVLAELSLEYVKNASLGMAADLVGRLRTFAGTEGTRPEVRKQIDAQIRTFGEPARAAAVVDALMAHDNLRVSDLSRFFMVLPCEAAPELCELLEIERYEKPVRLALRDLVKNNPKVLAPKLLGSSGETTVRLLSVLDGLVDEDFVLELAEPLVAADDELRAACTKLLMSVKCPTSQDLLTEFAVSDNGTLRRNALRALVAFPPQDVPVHALRAEAQRKDFDERALDEKKMLFLALAKLEGRLASEFLADVVGRRPWFEKDHHAETRACAALALGEIDDESAIEAIRPYISDRSEAVRTAVRIALSRRGVPAVARS